MESYKKPIKAALSNLKKLARNKPKLKNAVSSITQSLDDLFKLVRVSIARSLTNAVN